MLGRSYQTSFYITIIPINDNPPVIRFFTSGNCSFTPSPPPVRRRSTTPQLSKKAKRHSTVQRKLKMVNSYSVFLKDYHIRLLLYISLLTIGPTHHRNPWRFNWQQMCCLYCHSFLCPCIPPLRRHLAETLPCVIAVPSVSEWPATHRCLGQPWHFDYHIPQA